MRACAAEEWVFLDDGDSHSELSGTNAGDVSTRAAADDDHVVLLLICHAGLLRKWSSGLLACRRPERPSLHADARRIIRGPHPALRATLSRKRERELENLHSLVMLIPPFEVVRSMWQPPPPIVPVSVFSLLLMMVIGTSVLTSP